MIKTLKNSGLQFIVLALLSVALSFSMIHFDYKVAIYVLFAIFSISTVSLILKDYSYGIYILILYGSFLFFIGRILRISFSYGIPFDLIIMLIFFAIILHNGNKKPFQWKTNELITQVLLVFYAYFILQIANPNSVRIGAWLYSARDANMLLLFYCFVHFFDSEKRIKYFNYAWITIALIVALYGLKQEFFGLTDFEWKFIRDKPNRYDLFFVWGHMRVFSILSDPSAYGLFLGFCGTATLMLSFAPAITNSKRIGYITITLILFYAMSFAGTRTAYAMVMAGVSLFIAANLKNRRILGGSLILVFIFLVLMFGPFYSGPINRMRSTFNMGEDASMSVRDAKRIRFQPYIQSHPIGGGINTAGNSGLSLSRGHPLAGRFDPDSGYLRNALEQGWVGLFITLLLFTAVIYTGLRNYYFLKKPMLQHYAMVFAVPFFGLSVAHYAQDAMYQKPVIMLVFATMALMVKLKDIDEND